MGDFLRMSLEGDWSEALDKLQDAAQSVKRSGANAMAEVFQTEAKVRAPVYAGNDSKVAKGKIKPGQLRDSIYRAYSKKFSNDDRAVYQISYNHQRAPHGTWMEHGNMRHAARPFLRPAYEAMKGAALQAGMARITVRFSEAINRLGQ